ncbi:hypothetical protein BKA69DRAFT_1170439 [Paraphysoderma sedebokerense]|nr:hypothetical protein BKA69DRAFT_1170439 [Paraphysoderma sedebokerense]
MASIDPVVVDNCVSVDTCRAHLTLLRQFADLEQSNEEADLMFLCRAEQRYILWLNMLASLKRNPDDIPLPPLDVCMFWCAHMLNPLRYMEDIQRLYPGKIRSYSIPLKRMEALFSSNTLDESSLGYWNAYNPKEPYVLPHSYNADDTTSIKCPGCQFYQSITLSAYVGVRIRGQSANCHDCDGRIDADTISAARYVTDINEFIRTKENRLAGAMINWATNTLDLHCNILALVDLFPTLFEYDVQKQMSQWEIILSLNRTHFVRKRLPRSSALVARSVTTSYKNLMMPFSFDLISAVLRQRKFTKKMVDPSWSNLNALAKATVRYHKFILLLSKKKNIFFVPTLDIDLGWHTHQLHPKRYQNYTEVTIGKVLNHDDDVGTKQLSSGFRQTALLWHKHFGEPYSSQSLGTRFITPKRVIASLLFPPYFIHSMFKYAKLNAATDKKSRFCNTCPHHSQAKVLLLDGNPEEGKKRFLDDHGATYMWYSGICVGSPNFYESSCGGSGYRTYGEFDTSSSSTRSPCGGGWFNYGEGSSVCGGAVCGGGGPGGC